MADNNRQQQPKKKKSGGAWGLIFLLVIWLIGRIDTGDLRRFFSRLQWMIQTGRFPIENEMLLAIGAAILVLVLVIVTVSRAKKAGAEKRFEGVRAAKGGTAQAHSHDRLAGYTVGAESGQEHWKKQLDGFLAAGIIDRSEYRVLLERRRR